MILIGDSGATKAEWKVIEGQKESETILSSGISPHYQDTEAMYQVLKTELEPHFNQQPESIYFYGTACSTENNKAMVREALKRLFPLTSHIEVEHDLLSAARALCEYEPGMACIAGTGSNACFYDGRQIIWQPVNLGFLLGDEGSGAYLGKILVTAYMHEELPPHLMAQFHETYHLTREILLVNLYQRAYPSRYLASFSKFLHNHLEDPYCKEIVKNNFALFFDKYVCKYKAHAQYPVHFVGSIAYHFKAVLEEVARQKGLHLGKIIKTPMSGLLEYHVKRDEGK